MACPFLNCLFLALCPPLLPFDFRCPTPIFNTLTNTPSTAPVANQFCRRKYTLTCIYAPNPFSGGRFHTLSGVTVELLTKVRAGTWQPFTSNLTYGPSLMKQKKQRYLWCCRAASVCNKKTYLIGSKNLPVDSFTSELHNGMRICFFTRARTKEALELFERSMRWKRMSGLNFLHERKVIHWRL